MAHTSRAGAAGAYDSLDLRGGAVLLPELLHFLPSYYFCLEYISTLAACSRSMKQQVLNKKSLERLSSGFGSTRASSRSSSDTGNVQVVGDCSNYQFVTTPAHAAEQNPTDLYVAIAFDWPSPDQQSSGYRAAYSLLGCACFQINIPDHVRTLRSGVENPRGPEAVWMNVHELFTERMCFNFGLVPSQTSCFTVCFICKYTCVEYSICFSYYIYKYVC